jgi:8-oxo-dGTP pyrophosphatase MutT (NUDIX family)
MADEPRLIRAAGGVVWRPVKGGSSEQVEVAIIHRPRYDDWTIPKGKLAGDEGYLDAALREVFEETGYRVRPGAALGEVRYTKASSGVPRPKVVRYWAMLAVSGAFSPGKEVDELRWLTLEEAATMLTRDSDREVLERFRLRLHSPGED